MTAMEQRGDRVARRPNEHTIRRNSILGSRRQRWKSEQTRGKSSFYYSHDWAFFLNTTTLTREISGEPW